MATNFLNFRYKKNINQLYDSSFTLTNSNYIMKRYSQQYFDQQYRLRYFEMNESGYASPVTMLTLLEEAAADHCHAIDHSLFQLAQENKGWVLVSGCMEMKRYPGYKEKIRVRTWLSQYSNVKGFRENVVFDEKDNVIGRAKGLWVFYDIEKRRPAPIYETIKHQWPLAEEPCIDVNINQKIQPISSAKYTKEHHVDRSDTDMNKHVNNVKYLQWLIDSIPEEMLSDYDLKFIDGRFVGEAQLGDTIVSLNDSADVSSAFTHTIKVKNTNKVCATANTLWEKK